jgi:hypothetical protein
MDCGTLAALPRPLGMASRSQGFATRRCSHGDWRASRLGMLAESNVAVDLSPAIHSTRHKTVTDLTSVGRIAFAQIPRHPIFSVAGVITYFNYRSRRRRPDPRWTVWHKAPVSRTTRLNGLPCFAKTTPACCPRSVRRPSATRSTLIRISFQGSDPAVAVFP